MNRSKHEKQKQDLTVIVSAAVEKRVEEAVNSKISHIEDAVLARVIARLEPASQNKTDCAYAEPAHKFFDGLAGP